MCRRRCKFTVKLALKKRARTLAERRFSKLPGESAAGGQQPHRAALRRAIRREGREARERGMPARFDTEPQAPGGVGAQASAGAGAEARLLAAVERLAQGVVLAPHVVAGAREDVGPQPAMGLGAR